MLKQYHNSIQKSQLQKTLNQTSFISLKQQQSLQQQYFFNQIQSTTNIKRYFKANYGQTARCKKYQQEIIKINQKIKIAEDKKRKLNISFRPFTVDSKAKSQKNQSIKIQQKYKKEQFQYKQNIQESQKKTYKDVFIKRIFYQIELDRQFRNIKIWFQMFMLKDKWFELKNCLQQRQIQMSDDEINKYFLSTLKDHNPFLTWEETKYYSINKLIDSFEDGIKYWKQFIQKKHLKTIIQEIFKMNNCNQVHQHISNQNFVQIINTFTNQNYQQRDTYLIFKRISPQNECTFQHFISIFSK